MRRAAARSLAAALLLSLPSGCEIFGGDCTSLGHFAFELTIVDISTNRPPPGAPTITVTDGPFVETIPAPGQTAVIQPQYLLVVERAGVYSVRVEVPGYLTWQQAGIEVVRTGRCNELQTRRLRIELVRAS